MEEAKVIQQWGAFYFLRKALSVNTRANHWQIEAGKIILKILLCLVAFVLDILTGALFLMFLGLKGLVIVLAQAVLFLLKGLVNRVLGLLTYLIAMLLTIGLLYVIITHWSEFKGLINWLIHLING